MLMTLMQNRRMRMEDKAPFAINFALGAVVVGGADFIAALAPRSESSWRCAVVAVTLGLFAAFTADWLAIGALVLPAWMVMNGFLVNTLGDLSWHGKADVYRFASLGGAAICGLIAGEIGSAVADLRNRERLGELVHAMTMDLDEETERRV